MEDLTCLNLLNCLGNLVSTEKVLKNKKVIVFYFSASFCTPCEDLLPKLRLLQEAIKEHRKCGIVIIYVPFDTDEQTMIKHFKEHHHGWHCIPLKEQTIKILELKYNISYLPQIIVVKMDGTIVTRDGRKDLDEHGNNVIIRWSEPDITSFRYLSYDWITMSNEQRRKEERKDMSGNEYDAMSEDASIVTDIKGFYINYLDRMNQPDEPENANLLSQITNINKTISKIQGRE